MSRLISTSPKEAALTSAQLAEYENISERLHAETEGLSTQHPRQWAGMNSDQVLALADTLQNLLAKLRPDGDHQRIVAVLHLDPDPPETIFPTTQYRGTPRAQYSRTGADN